MSALDISLIRTDGGTQPRATLHQDWVEEYATDMLAGATFPAVVVFYDGAEYWLADGFHRTFAAEVAGAIKIEADIRQGTQRDAILFSVSANAAHGQRRTNEDKRRAVLCLLNDAEWSRETDREIARRCGVSNTFVGNLRPQPICQPLTDAGPSGEIPQIDQPRVVHRGGATYTQNTAGINQNRDRAPAAGGGAKSPLMGVSQTEAYPAAYIPPFDHEAMRVRNSAMDAIRALSKQPSPEVVMDAWNKCDGYGEPMETLEAALAWLSAFIPLYQHGEPIRWAQRQEQLKNVA